MSTEGISNTVAQKEIVVVDDDPDLVDLIEIVLSYEGYKVDGFTEGESFLRHVEQKLKLHRRPDLVLLDIVMPGLSGVEVARKLRTIAGCEDLAIICVTACRPEDKRSQDISSLCKSILRKPFEIKDLLSSVNRTLNLQNKNNLS